MTRTLDLTTLLPRLTDLALRAGEAILEVYGGYDPEVTLKADDSPLTRADLESHRILAAGLAELTPEVPILSEEGAEAPYSERRSWDRFWLVDPLDGTKEFLRKNGEFTVNVALVEGGVPILGIVHAPTLERTYTGASGHGAFRRDGDGQKRPIRASGTDGEGFVAVASRSHPGPHLTAFLDRLGEPRVTSMGSSLKLCLVAEGQADVYPRLGPTMEWDTGAAHAVVLAAGGRVIGLDGEALRYNKEDLHNPYFMVLGERMVPWREAAGTLEG